MSRFSALLDEIVNYGSHVSRWCLEKKKEGDENAVSILMFRNILELIHSISILIKTSCADPCNILLRSLFESFLNLNYLLKQISNKEAWISSYGTSTIRSIF